ncbi:MAG: sulfatase-like hydrolase/transferase [Planctomycetes bacterium]|nr:sulfatase-like hydrolase/transferase [Planctomycetota bacterium]
MPVAFPSATRVLAAIAGLILAPFAVAQTTPPNLLLIVPDDLGIDAVGCYGWPTAAATPNLDALAQSGMRFTHCFVNPACSPTRAAILTGRYAFRSDCTGALSQGALGMVADALTIAAPLNAAGYQTAMIGKWHLGNRFGNVTPGAYGWSHFEGVLDSGVANPYQWPKITNGLVSTCTQYIMTDQVDSAISWIQSQTGPWALVLTPTLPHVPFHTPPANLHTQNLAGLNPVTTPRPFFEAMVQAMDNEVGRLLASIGPTTLANTNVVVIGDNGTDGAVALPPLSSTRAKGSMHDGGSRVPLIVRGPAVANPGTVATEMVNAIDLFPTMLAMCGISFPPPPIASAAAPLDGQGFAAALTGQTGYGRPYVYNEISSCPLGDGYTIRTATHRLVRYEQNQPQHQEFYNLVTDPYATTNLLGGSMSPADQAAFQQIMATLQTVRSDGWGELFGNGCSGNAGVPLLRWQTRPQIGHTFVAYMGNLSANCFNLMGVLGLSRTASLGNALPLSLDALGMTGCNLNVSLDLIVPIWVQNGFGVYLPIPDAPALYQLEFYLQGIAYETGANPASAVLSRGLRCVIGN